MGGGIVGGLTYLGGGLGLIGLSKILAQVLPFISGRIDARQKRMDAQQARLDQRYDARLAHLEIAEANSQSRMSVLEEVVNILTAELRAIDPANSKLSDVARMLRHSIPAATHPLDTPADMIEQLKRM